MEVWVAEVWSMRLIACRSHFHHEWHCLAQICKTISTGLDTSMTNTARISEQQRTSSLAFAGGGWRSILPLCVEQARPNIKLLKKMGPQSLYDKFSRVTWAWAVIQLPPSPVFLSSFKVVCRGQAKCIFWLRTNGTWILNWGKKYLWIGTQHLKVWTYIYLLVWSSNNKWSMSTASRVTSELTWDARSAFPKYYWCFFVELDWSYQPWPKQKPMAKNSNTNSPPYRA